MQRMFTLAGAALLALAVGCDDSILTPSETPSASKTAACILQSRLRRVEVFLRQRPPEVIRGLRFC